jgi:molybdopterin-guanine dinucleotide biosynthesis adapter protein
MEIFGLAGYSSSGKTTLMVRLLPILTSRGLEVSTLKHAHHGFDVDQPGKDSHRHRAAGAREVMVSSANRWALMHELRGAPEADVESLINHRTPVDLLIIEGFKRHPHAKLECHRGETGKPLLAAEDATIVALASDRPVPGLSIPRFALDDVEAIAGFIMSHCGLEARRLPQAGLR